MDGTTENHGFLFKTEESAAYVAIKAEENTWSDFDTAYRLFKAEDEEAEADRPLLVVHYTLPAFAVTDGVPTMAAPAPAPAAPAAPAANADPDSSVGFLVGPVSRFVAVTVAVLVLVLA